MTARAGHICKGALIGFSLGLVIAVGAASWVWLEMRVNVGLLIPATTVLFSILAFWKKSAFSYLLFFLAQLLLVITLLTIYGLDAGALWSIPAYIFREGFHGTGLTRGTAGLMVGGILLGGNLFWIAFSGKRMPSGKKRQLLSRKSLVPSDRQTTRKFCHKTFASNSNRKEGNIS